MKVIGTKPLENASDPSRSSLSKVLSLLLVGNTHHIQTSVSGVNQEKKLLVD